MTTVKNFSILTLNSEKISDVNKIIVQFSDSSRRSSSHILFNMEPINLNSIVEDLTFFTLSAKNENDLNKKMDDIVQNLNQIDTDYTIRDENSGEIITTIGSVGALTIKFENIQNLPKNAFEKIDELKNLKTEFGYCRGYKPTFRPIKSKTVKDSFIKPEKIYMFSKSHENLLKLKDIISNEVLEIDSEFELEFKVYAKDYLEKL